MKIIRIITGVVLCLISAPLVVVSIIGIFDPVGLKGGDDNDPFGTPPSRIEIALMTAAFAAVGVGGLSLIFQRPKNAQ